MSPSRSPCGEGVSSPSGVEERCGNENYRLLRNTGDVGSSPRMHSSSEDWKGALAVAKVESPFRSRKDSEDDKCRIISPTSRVGRATVVKDFRLPRISSLGSKYITCLEECGIGSGSFSTGETFPLLTFT